MKNLLLSVTTALLVLSGCSKSTEPTPTTTTTTPTTTTATVSYVNVSSVQQEIDGFGGSTAWSGALSNGEFNSLYSNSTSDQLGLSIIRLRIDPGGSANWGDEKSNAAKAKARGAFVFATPWTPPISMKNNNNIVGGTLDTAQYSNYAAYLKSFCDFVANVDAISLQNEPDFDPDYESCSWNATQFLNFTKYYAPAIGKPIMMPESYNYTFSLSDPTLNDSTAAAHVTYVGGHIYGATIKKYTNALNKGKKTWMTEHYFDGNDITASLNTAKEIHDCMTIANNSAYVWWTLKAFTCFIIENGVLNTKGYTIGQFSKFIRPGYYRIDATVNPHTNIYVSAYKGDNKVVIVAINMGTSAYKQPFTIQNQDVVSVTPYTTSASKSILQGSLLTVSGGSFTASLDAQSITTFVAE